MSSEVKDNSALKHILAYCIEIENTLAEINNDRNIYNTKNVYRNALALCVLQIGELVGIISDEYKNNHRDVPWKSIKQMRNIVAHKYGSFDFDVLWEVVTEDIPTLKEFCMNNIIE